jgi:hypothetical protein
LQQSEPHTLGILRFENFLADALERPPGCTLDRANPCGDYVPDNIRWATRSEQARNKRPRANAVKREPEPPPLDIPF